MITARELRTHFGGSRTPDYFRVAVAAAREQAAAVAPAAVVIESLTISADAMPHHYVARAVILDLQPSQMVAAIGAVEDAICRTHRHATRTGWRGASDGLTIYFHEHTPNHSAVAAPSVAA